MVGVARGGKAKAKAKPKGESGAKRPKGADGTEQAEARPVTAGGGLGAGAERLPVGL